MKLRLYIWQGVPIDGEACQDSMVWAIAESEEEARGLAFRAMGKIASGIDHLGRPSFAGPVIDHQMASCNYAEDKYDIL